MNLIFDLIIIIISILAILIVLELRKPKAYKRYNNSTNSAVKNNPGNHGNPGNHIETIYPRIRRMEWQIASLRDNLFNSDHLSDIQKKIKELEEKQSRNEEYIRKFDLDKPPVPSYEGVERVE